MFNTLYISKHFAVWFETNERDSTKIWIEMEKVETWKSCTLAYKQFFQSVVILKVYKLLKYYLFSGAMYQVTQIRGRVTRYWGKSIKRC